MNVRYEKDIEKDKKIKLFHILLIQYFSIDFLTDVSSHKKFKIIFSSLLIVVNYFHFSIKSLEFAILTAKINVYLIT